MRRRAPLLLLACFPLGGCAWLLGHAEPPQPPAPWLAPTPLAIAEGGPVRVSAVFRGLGERLVAERNPLGRVGVVVNPYGEDALIFEVTVENRGAEPVVVRPQAATLALGERLPAPARSLADYRRRWPLWATTGPEERAHRAAAYDFLMETLLIERQVAPGASTSGRLAFALAPASDAMRLVLPVWIGLARREVTLTWSL